MLRQLALMAALLPLSAAEPTAPPFADGATVCFIGDSITHGGFTWANIALFYATRYPDRRIAWCNRGVTGDYAGGVLKRFDWDIAPCKPTVSVVMLGMNDVGRDLYGMADPPKGVLDQRRWNLSGYATNMGKLADRVAGIGSTLVLMTPSIYDQTRVSAAKSFAGVNEALGTCAATVRELAAKRVCGLVDLHGPMTALNAERQKADPAFTLIGDDRVHPGGVGELVMAYLFLRAQGCTPVIATMGIDAAKGMATGQENCAIDAIAVTADGIAFTALEHALPFPVFAHQANALDLVPFVQDLDQEILRVGGLATGSWEVAIDGRAVATCSAAELATGVNLARNDQTPQYGQALLVADGNFKRQALVSRKLRTIAAVYHTRLAAAGVAIDDYAAAKRVLQPLLAAEKSDWVAGLMRTYLECKPQEPALIAELAALDAKIRTDSQPKPHRYALRRMP
jgi:lysophospholipase L1-like esterase